MKIQGDAAFLGQLLGAVQHSIIAIDRQERITYWNSYASKFYGYSAEEALGQRIQDVTARGSDGSRQILDVVWRGETWTGEFPVAHRDGSSIPARVRLFPVYDGTGDVTGIIGVSEDISAEWRARERFDLLARSTSEAVWEWEPATNSLWGNAAYYELVGPPVPGQTAEEQWMSRIHPEDLEKVMESKRRRTPVFNNEYRFLSHRTGQYLRVMDRGFLVRDEQGNLLRVVGSVTDISQYKEIEQAYQASKDRFRLLFEESPIGIVIFDDRFVIRESNGAYARMLGYLVNELLGQNLIELTHPEDQNICARMAAELFTGEQPYFRLEKRYLRKDGSTVWTSITATTLPGREGSPPLGFALIEDITEQKETRDELVAARARVEAAMGAKIRFLAQISHEIRSPMNGVLGMLELLDGSELDAEQRDQVTTARQAAMSLLGMLEEILDLTRLDQQRLALHPREYSPAALVRDIASLYRVRAKSRGVEMRLSIGDDVPAAHMADPGRVRQILINLIDNAMKFTVDGYVAVQLSVRDGQLCWAVEDSGIGIPEGSIDTVFEAFSDISARTNASMGGTGLGLAISQRLARLMGGEISVSSRLGEGARFELILPLGKTSGGVVTAEATAAALALAPKTHPGRRILVVEDNHLNQRVAAGLLRRLDCEVDVADNGVDALRLALANPYDAIFMDAMMPVMDGFETTAELRRREPAGRHSIVIGLTALATQEDRERCLEAGMDDYLPKPTNLEALGAVLGRWLKEVEKN